MRSSDEAVLREFVLRGFAKARQRANEFNARNRDFAQRVYDTYSAAYSPLVHATAGNVLKGSSADWDWFVRTGFAEAKAQDNAAREADEQHKQQIAQADRDFVRLLSTADPGEQVRQAAEYALRNGGLDADIREFFASGWMAAAGLDVELFRLRTQDAGMYLHATISQLIIDAQEAEKVALESSGEAAVKARAVAAGAWADTKQKADAATKSWDDERKLCLEQARYWQTVLERAGTQADPVWQSIGAAADKQRGTWTTESAFAEGQAQHWGGVSTDAQAGYDRMTGEH
ncbi:Short repeat-containing protein of unknown function [Amycolatopsis xylanica]|uniref:Uncharacterized protein n=1 Tax=Amycolatopsis xylanica TaxID=589385 RepID=A0A1H2WET6_9PSEU|nr:Short repeat-containing protein of unknown function [Amycolatopsis xylanica]